MAWCPRTGQHGVSPRAGPPKRLNKEFADLPLPLHNSRKSGSPLRLGAQEEGFLPPWPLGGDLGQLGKSRRGEDGRAGKSPLEWVAEVAEDYHLTLEFAPGQIVLRGKCQRPFTFS